MRVGITIGEWRWPLTGTHRNCIETALALAKRVPVTLLLDRLPHGAGAPLTLAHQLELRELENPASFAGLDAVYYPRQADGWTFRWVRDHTPVLVPEFLDAILYQRHDILSEQGRALWLHENSNGLAASEGIAFLTENAYQVAQSYGLVSPDSRTAVVYAGASASAEAGTVTEVLRRLIGAEAAPHSADGEVMAERYDDEPVVLERVLDRPYLTLYGADYPHKGRTFALELFRRVVETGWDGAVVLVSGRVAGAGTTPRDKEMVASWPDAIRSRVYWTQWLPDRDLWRIVERSTLVLAPSEIEGFGLTPFEAASLGVPALTCRVGVLDDLAPDGFAFLDHLDPAGSAELVRSFVETSKGATARREALLATMSALADRLTWDATADHVLRLLVGAGARPKPRRRAHFLTGSSVSYEAASHRSRERLLAGKSPSAVERRQRREERMPEWWRRG